MQTDEGEILEEGSPKVSEMEHEDFVMEGHGKTPPPGEENKQQPDLGSSALGLLRKCSEDSVSAREQTCTGAPEQSASIGHLGKPCKFLTIYLHFDGLEALPDNERTEIKRCF